MRTTVHGGRRGRAGAAALAALLLLAGVLPAPARAAVCSNPGQDGAATIGGVVNSYYPGVSAPAGSTSVTVGTIDTSGGGAATPIGVGDLILIMQMQDADIDFTNTSSYGGSSPGTGYTALNSAGRYEYAVVASVAGSTIGLTAPLVNGYRNANYVAGVSGQRRFQVIRVPQYSSASFVGTVYPAPPWNGATGGVVAVDVAGTLSWNGATIEVSGRGFRGGGGRNLTGAAGRAATDYVSSAGTNAHASKGEGIAGTPQYVFTPSSAAVANYLTNGAGAVTNTGVEGYPGGSNARGAPGNAGGGGSDGNPTNNDQNSGGGGGGAYAVGGMGGYGWTSATPPGSKTGGFGGYSVPMGPGLLTLGGGGGAGDMNNNTGTPASGPATSGGAGGGVVIIRARTITGTGTINANGANANNTVANDASGGGGGGGAVLVFASANGGSLGSLTVNARGGNGGTNAPGSGVNPHGPGGGGSGGFVGVTSASGVTIAVDAGVNGTTNTSATTTAEYGATASSGGWRLYSFQASDMPGATTNALCLPLLTVTKTATRADVTRGGTAGYVLTVQNAVGYGTATGVSLADALPGAPAAFTFSSTDGLTLTGGATRSATVEPAAGSTAPSWGTFALPGGAAVTVRFSVGIPAGTTPATYQNSGTVSYVDPTRTGVTLTTVSPGGTYAGGGTVPGSNYGSATSTQEDVSVWLPATVTKSFTPASVGVGQPSVLAIVITNPNAVALTSAAFTDTYPANLVNTATPGASISGTGCSGLVTAAAGGGSVSLSSGTIPASGSCTVQVNVTGTAAGSFGNVIPAGALTNGRNVVNTAAASATLSQAAVQAPSVTTAFLPSTIQQGAVTTLQITLFNGGTTALTGVALTDTLTSMQVAATPSVVSTCGGAVTAAAGAGSVSLTGGALAAGATCTVTVQVTSATISPALGHPNQVTGVTSTQSGAGPSSNTALLVVAGTPTIAKAFSPTQIGPGATSTLTFTLTNPGNVPLTGATFGDPLGNLRVAVAGPAGGTCPGAAGNTLGAGTTNLVLSGLTLPAAGSCTVTVPVTGTSGGPQVNVANGVASNETPVAGPQSAAATLTVLFPPGVTKSFAGVVEAAVAASYSTLSITLSNPNPGAGLTGVGFTDDLVNMVVHSTPAATNGCGGSLTAAAGGAVVSLTGGSLAAGASCTVTVRVRSGTPSPSGGHPNTVAATSTETGAGVAATAYLNVLSPPTIAAVFSPAAITTSTGTSTLVFTLSNPNAIALSGVTFSNTFPASLTTTNVGQNYVGSGRGTCTGPIPSAQAAGTYATSVSFSAINIPANSSCTVYVDVRSAVAGSYSDTSSGVTSFQTPTIGPVSNTATLSVGGIGISKAFAPAAIAVNGTSTLTFTLNNRTGAAQNTIAFTDAFPANMRVASPLTTTNGCGGTLRNQGNTAALAVGDTGLRYTGGSLASNTTCTVSVAVTVTAAGSYSNTATALTWGGAGTGPNSAPATLLAVAHPTIAVAFSPATLDLYATSTMTFTLSNSNGSTLASARFTDTLTGFAVTSPATLGGSCAGVVSAPALVAGATALDLTVPFLLPGSCTINIPVTRANTTPGTFTNTTSGLTTTQTGSAGPVSNTASITFNKLPLQVLKSTTLVTVTPGTAVTYTISYANPNASTSFGNVVITDVTPQFTSFSAASCGALPAGITSCTIAAPAVGSAGTVTWTLGGALQAGASGTVSLTVVVN